MLNFKKKTSKIIAICVSIIVLLFASNRLFFFKKGFLENTANTLLYPVICTSGKITGYIHEIIAQKKNRAFLEQQYNLLQTKHDKLLEQFTKLRSTFRYKKLSKELINFQKRYDLSSAILAKVLVKNFSCDQHYCLINLGSRDNIKIDMIAVYKLQIIGRVIEVSPFYSKIQFITDKNCKIASFTNITNASGIVSGTNKINRCNLTYVSHLSPVQTDDLIFSSGRGTIFPEGFCLGRIIKHELKRKELYHTIQIEPLIDLTSLDFCLLTDQSKIRFF